MRNEQKAAELGCTLNKEGTVILNARGRKVAAHASNDYLVFDFGPKCDRKRVSVHRLQAWFKFGEALYADKIQVRHLDGNPLNNHADNLALGTQSQNMMDRPAENRRASAYIASRRIAKHDHAAVITYYKIHGFKKTLEFFGISSKGTLSFILNKTRTGTPVTAEERPKKIAPTAGVHRLRPSLQLSNARMTCESCPI